MRRSAFFLAPALVLGLSGAPAGAAPPEGAAELVARSLRSELFSSGSVRVRAHLVLSDKDGKRQERAFSAWAKRDAQGLRRTLVRFEAPASVEGVAFLMTQRDREADEQHLYLPKFKSTRRIAGAADDEDRSGAGDRAWRSHLSCGHRRARAGHPRGGRRHRRPGGADRRRDGHRQLRRGRSRPGVRGQGADAPRTGRHLGAAPHPHPPAGQPRQSLGGAANLAPAQ